MRKVKFSPVLLILLIFALAMVVGNTYARYAKKETVTGTLTVSANLGEISMSEETIQAKIIPGVDIPVNHTVVITGKSSIKAYVYLVIELPNDITNDSKLRFALLSESPWKEIQKTTADGKTTTVYVYVNNGTPVVVINNVEISVAGLLEVSQYVNVPDSVNMTFTAMMYEKMTDDGASVEDATDVYEKFNNSQS